MTEESAGDAGTPAAGTLGGRYVVALDQPLPELDSDAASGHVARDLREPGQSLYALVADPSIPRRQDVWRTLSASPVDGVLSPLASGFVDFPGGRGRWWTAILPRPAGRSLAGAIGALGDKEVRGAIAPALVARLSALHRHDVIHRRLRPDTVFWMQPGGTELVLAECFSEPPGASQPAAWEPLNRALAHPHGRGTGGPADDCYALGVTLLALSRNGTPWTRMSADALNADRLARGSFAALTDGGGGVPAGLTSLLRGLLADSVEERWTLADAANWLNGARIQPRTRHPPREPLTPLRIAGRSAATRRQIADALARSPADALRTLHSPGFSEWIIQGLSDPATANRIERVLAQHPPTRRAGEALAVARVVQILDPAGPVRIGPAAFMVDGLAPMLAAASAATDRSIAAALDEALTGGLIDEALDLLPDSGGNTQARREASLAVEYLRRREIGYGLERALYVLNRHLGCQSVRLPPPPPANAAGVLLALEQLAATGDLPSPLIDRHIAAFLATHGATPRMIAGLSKAAEPGPRQVLASLRLLAPLQAAAGGMPLPRLCAALADGLRPLVGALRGQVRRERLTARMSRLGAGSDLSALLKGFDFAAEREEDERDYRLAVEAWLAAEAEGAQLAAGITPEDPAAREAGLVGAATLAYSILTLVTLASLAASWT